MGFFSVWNAVKFWDKKHLLIPALLTIIEGGIAVSSFPEALKTKNSAFIVKNQRMAERSVSSLAFLYYEAPVLVKYSLGIVQVEKDALKEAFANQTTIKSIDGLFEKDRQNRHSEIHGIITLDYDSGEKPFLRFYDYPTINELNSVYLNTNKNSQDKILEFLEKNKEHYIQITSLSENVFSELLSLAKNGNSQQQRFALGQLVDLYVDISDYRAYDTTENVSAFYYEHFWAIEGKIIGRFHTHELGEPPSDADISSSRLMRQFVLSKKEKKHGGDSYVHYELYDISHGKAEKIEH